jgi:hypothetical protein
MTKTAKISTTYAPFHALLTISFEMSQTYGSQKTILLTAKLNLQELPKKS